MKNHRLFTLIFTILALGTSGCLSSLKTDMLQGGGFKVGEPTLVENKAPIYKLQPSDVLSIRIKSLDSKQVEYLSLESEGVMNVNPAATFMSGYSVSDSGFIHMPGVGKMKVAGLSLSEARDKIQQRVRQTEVGDATVFLTLVNFKVSIVGEVARPDQYYAYNNQFNLIEAISMAGGFTDFANRGTVKLVRQTLRGSEVTILDLRSADFLTSPYYYLQPNDMIVVDAMKEKHQRGNLSTLVIINTLVSGISATVAIVSIIQRNNTPVE
ncbi:MAG: polysaccharide biosynthesis/export family protein [Bacteroidia bacterium]|nr:polysaccharide biosynthesis/export family protein [Bacteroidia bacterium]